MCLLWLSRLSSPFSFIGDQNPRILILGLDAAGKTKIFYKLMLNEDVTTVPTIGFNVETVTSVEDVALTVWDVCGQENIRHLWRYYYKVIAFLCNKDIFRNFFPVLVATLFCLDSETELTLANFRYFSFR